MDLAEIPYSERHYADTLADLYAVVVAIERLEKVHHRDLVSIEDYEATLRRLLDKYASIVSQLQQLPTDATTTPNSATQSMSRVSPLTSSFASPDSGFDLEVFWNEYCSKCSAARQRIRSGHPQDIKKEMALQQAAAASDASQRAKALDPKLVLECGQYFITLMDSLKLQQTAVDQLFPILSDLVIALHKFPNATEVLGPLVGKLEAWVARLNRMHPSDEVDERGAREFAFDLERGYQTFYHFLSGVQQQGSGGIPPGATVGAQ